MHDCNWTQQQAQPKLCDMSEITPLVSVLAKHNLDHNASTAVTVHEQAYKYNILYSQCHRYLLHKTG